MSEKGVFFHRRRFLKTALGIGAAVMTPHVASGVVRAQSSSVPPSEKIVLGAIGIGGRGGDDLRYMLQEKDVQCVAVCDVRTVNREKARRMVDSRYGNKDCATYVDYHDILARDDIDALLIATGPNWQGLLSIFAAKAGKDVYCEKPCSRNIALSLELAATFKRTGRVFQGGMQRRNLPGFYFAIQLARHGQLGKLKTLHAHPAGLGTGMSGWGTPDKVPLKPGEADWDLYLGPAAWRPFNRNTLHDGFNFEKGGGLVGGGVLEWGSHCVDLCQWANDADHTVPVEYYPAAHDQATARYANGVELVMRNGGWLPNIGSCPVRFEGETGWVETGDSGDVYASTPSLLQGWGNKRAGYPQDSHIRDFFNCVKTRGQPRANAEVACNTHIACHAANIAIFLNRKLTFDPMKHEFIGDAEANRLRSEALREPWHV